MGLSFGMFPTLEISPLRLKSELHDVFVSAEVRKNSDLRIHPTYEICLMHRKTTALKKSTKSGNIFRHTDYSICTKQTGTVHICPNCKISGLCKSDLGEFDCS